MAMRYHRQARYISISEWIAATTDLTLEEKGLMLVFSTFGDEGFSRADVLEKMAESKNVFVRVFASLQRKNYALRVQRRDNSGQYEYDYEIYDSRLTHQQLEQKEINKSRR